jgi:hypothetical protein
VDVTEHSSERTSEPDVEADEAQVEPGSDDGHVGRVAGDDAIDDETTGAEARAAGSGRNDKVE